MDCAKAIARAAETAAIATKSAAYAMADAVAAVSGDPQPQPPPVAPPGKRGRKRAANVASHRKSTLIKHACAFHEARIPVQGGDDGTSGDGPGSGEEVAEEEGGFLYSIEVTVGETNCSLAEDSLVPTALAGHSCAMVVSGFWVPSSRLALGLLSVF